MQTKPFDLFKNPLCQSTFSQQAENSIFTVIQFVTLQTYCAPKKIKVYFDTVYHATAHYTTQLLYSICNQNIWFLLLELKRYLAQ